CLGRVPPGGAAPPAPAQERLRTFGELTSRHPPEVEPRLRPPLRGPPRTQGANRAGSLLLLLIDAQRCPVAHRHPSSARKPSLPKTTSSTPQPTTAPIRRRVSGLMPPDLARGVQDPTHECLSFSSLLHVAPSLGARDQNGASRARSQLPERREARGLGSPEVEHRLYHHVR